MIYLRARYYDPSTGQFISRDPIVSITRQPYAYVRGNPLNLTDPSGLFGISDVLTFGQQAFQTVESNPAFLAPLVIAAPYAVALGVIGWATYDTLSNNRGFFQTIDTASDDSGPDSGLRENGTNWHDDKKCGSSELKGKGLDAHDLKEHGHGTDIFKDKLGNLYEKPSTGAGPGSEIGINIKNLPRIR